MYSFFGRELHRATLGSVHARNAWPGCLANHAPKYAGASQRATCEQARKNLGIDRHASKSARDSNHAMIALCGSNFTGSLWSFSRVAVSVMLVRVEKTIEVRYAGVVIGRVATVGDVDA